jgi:glyoxylase-like metal-dependent hydrolase (beta-lactamase superfamily II)
VVDDGATWVVDTGFGADDAARRGRRLLRTAAEALALLEIDAATVTDVILTHLHYDHAGGFLQFPAARFHLQDRELAFATGRHMATATLNHPFTVDHVAGLVHEVYGGRVAFHAGDDELAPGLSVHHLGGHTDGLQVVRVRTERGWLVLASDATHYYENMEAVRPFPVVFDVGAMVQGFATLRRLASSDDAIVPGHDPLVLERYPPAAPGLEGIAVRLDQGRRQGAS